MQLSARVRRGAVRPAPEALRRQPVRKPGRVFREERGLLLPLPRLVGGRPVREAHDAHTVQTAVGADAAGTVLARADHRVRGARRDRAGLVRQAPLPGEDREATRGRYAAESK